MTAPGMEMTLALLAATPGWQALTAARPDLDDDLAAAILGEAEKFAQGALAPLNAVSDRQGCRLEGGRVATPEGFAEAYARMGRDGWLAMDLPEALGGQGLPTTLHAAASPHFEGAAMAFMMAGGSSRAAAHMLARVAPDVAAEWGPKLASGDWAASICISEPDAGSDVGRIRTRAEKVDGIWRITGNKVWISFGDHDMSRRIGHCLLARTGRPGEGTRGLSLFLVPDRLDDGAGNGVTVTRIEEKMGLHGSPTCALSFDESQATLLGEAGRGIRQIFAMIELMRLQTACQGLGVAQAACRQARGYAHERRQGGQPDRPPVPILAHADVRRQLAVMESRTAVLEALVTELASLLDLARDGDAEAGTLAAMLLPLAKNFGAETAFETANGAVQVLGGAGYTRDWPAEQMVRDARVIAIYEGTTGIQAQDFLLRRVLADGAGAPAPLSARMRADLDACPDRAAAETADDLLSRFEALVRALRERAPDLSPPELAADGMLRAGWAVVGAWMACRLIGLDGEAARLGRFRLHGLPAEMAAAEAACHLPDALIGGV
ncbi:acyl-CoA dehydrogenase [Rhodobacteraceae bacterium WD3A24]|nr:acyl-CoA dehydrogenase [Rhodobacteraceae bacterium WD3A24]